MLSHRFGACRTLALLIGSLGCLCGCEVSPSTSRAANTAPPVDPEVAAVEQRVAEHLAVLRNMALEPSQQPTGPAVPPPDVGAEREEQSSSPRRNVLTPAPPAVVATVPAEPPPSEPEPVADKPEPVIQPLDRAELLDLLHHHLRDSRDPAMDRALASVGLSLLDPARPLDESLLRPLTPSQRDRVVKYHELVVSLGRSIAAGGQADLDSVQAKLNELFKHPVEIRTFALCRRVDGYGMYEPFESHVFPSGRSLRLGLYVEIDHFAARKDGEFYEVNLSQEVMLFRDDLIVWREPVAQVVDRSRNRRRDFFTTQVIQLPATLGSGKYTLKVRITDHTSNTIDERAHTLQLVADPAMAGARQPAPARR